MSTVVKVESRSWSRRKFLGVGGGLLATRMSGFGSLKKRVDGPSFVACFRGASGEAATGIPVIANDLRRMLSAPYEYYVGDYSSNESHAAVQDIRRMIARWPGKFTRVILVGHSLGAERALTLHGVDPGLTIQMVVSLDPVGGTITAPFTWPGKTFNFWTRHGSVNGKPIRGAVNYNLTDEWRSRNDCFVTQESGGRHRITHTNIDDCRWMQLTVIDMVRQAIAE